MKKGVLLLLVIPLFTLSSSFIFNPKIAHSLLGEEDTKIYKQAILFDLSYSELSLEYFPIEPIVEEVLPQGLLTSEQLDEAARRAGWPPEIWEKMKNIVMCESHGNSLAHNGSDPNGGSYGLAQLNGTYWFEKAGEDWNQWADPVVNLRTALWLYYALGEHFGGGGGWYNCSLYYGYD